MSERHEIRPELPASAQKVLGAMVQADRPLMGSEFLRYFRGHFQADIPTDGQGEPMFRPQTWAVINLDLGMRVCEEQGLIEDYRDAGNAKFWRLTPAGERLVQK